MDSQRKISKLSKREIVRKVIFRQETEIVPYHLPCSGKLLQKLKKYFPGEEPARTLGNYLVWLIAKFPLSSEGRDEFGVLWDQSDLGGEKYPVDYPLKRASLEGYRFPAPKDIDRFAHLAKLTVEYQDLFKVACWRTLFERASFMRGMENLLVDLVENSSFVNKLLDKLLEFNLELVQEARKFDIDGIMLDDDYGTQKGLLFSPVQWRKYFKPRLAVLFDAVKQSGLPLIFHSDGDIRSIVPDLIETGVDVLNPIQPETMDIYALKQGFGKDLCLYGGISTQRTLPFGSKEEVKQEVSKAKEVLGRGGGYILAPGFACHEDVPWKNLKAFLEVAKGNF